MTSPPRFALRLPLSAEQRGRITDFSAEAGGAPGSTAGDALVLKGAWSYADPPAKGEGEPLRLRPIFPGFMQFVARKGQVLPDADDILLVDDEVDPEGLKVHADIEGCLIIRAASSDAVSALDKLGTIPGIGMSPTLAYYDPVTIGFDFLQISLLDPNAGLEPRSILSDGVHNPGTARWQQLAVAGFLNGSYQPVLRTHSDLADDDATGAPMPALALDKHKFKLHISLGWPLDRDAVPLTPIEPDFESIPTRVFLQHAGKNLREGVLAAQGADTVVQAIMQAKDSSDDWLVGLEARLSTLGFGSKALKSDIEGVLREFQIAARRTKLARHSPPPAEGGPRLPERDFRGLTQIDNPDPYAGPVSGRANRRTRGLIERWESDQLRSPILIPAMTMDAGSDVPTHPPVANRVDIWERQELRDAEPRFFSADFTRADVLNQRIGLTDLQTLGYYDSNLGGGPATLKPVAARYDEQVELLPRLCLGVGEAELIAALEADDPADPVYGLASTFRVVRAVSECENLGYMAVVVAYDGAGVSFGPCHWCIAGGQKDATSTTALGGLAAYFAWLGDEGVTTDPFPKLGLAAFEGEEVRASRRTPSTAKELARTLNNGREHAAVLGFLDDRGHARDMREEDVRNYMASWRSLYHWVNIARSDPDFTVTCFRMVVRRLQSMLATPMNPPTLDRTVSPKIGEIFRTEVLVAQLLRWHIKAPGGVVERFEDVDGLYGRKGTYHIRASKYVRAAVDNAQRRTDNANLDTRLQEELAKRIRIFAPPTSIHKELPGHFSDIADAPWIDAPAGRPPVVNAVGRTRGYRLDPRLRMLAGYWVPTPVPEP